MAVTKGTGAASAQLYVADTEGERDVGWLEGSNVFCKDTDKLYYLKAGAWVLLGGGSIITDLYGSLTAKYFLASPTAAAGVPSFRAMVEADLPTLSSNFIVQGTVDTKLSGAQFLGALATGLVKNTITTGVLSIATAGSDYSVPSGIESFTGAKTFSSTKLILAGSTSGTTTLNAAAVAGASTLTLQAIDGTIYSTGGIDVSLADGGTGASLSDPAAHTLMGWDNTDNAICFITIGANLTYTQATHTLSAAAGGGGGLTWNEVTGTAQDAAVDNGYICNNAALVTVTLPTTAAVGKVVRICGKGAGLWKVAQNADEYIHFGLNDTTTGTGGYLAATKQYDAVELLCTVADTGWTVISSIGNLTVV